METKENIKVLEKKWDISSAYFTKKNKYMVVFVNEDGKNAIEVLDSESMKPIDLPNFEGKSITSVGFSNDQKLIRMYVGGSNAPSDLYTYNFETKEQHQISDVLKIGRAHV